MKKLLTWFFFIAIAVASANGAAPIKVSKTALDSQLASNESSSFGSSFTRSFERRAGRAAAKAAPNRAPQFVSQEDVAGLPDLIANIYYSKEAPQQGLYHLKTSADDSYEFISEATKEYEWGGVIKDGVYYSTYVMPFMGGTYVVTVVGVDAINGDVLYKKNPFEDLSIDFSVIPQSQVYDPVSKRIYGICWDESGANYALCTMSYTADGPVSKIVKIYNESSEMRWNAIACDADGQLWGVRYNEIFDSETQRYVTTASTLVKINKLTGSVLEVGETGMLPSGHGDATIDLESGRMFWIVCEADGRSYLCELDYSTGKAEKLYEIPGEDEIVGLEVAPTPAADNAPAAVSGLNANFPKGALTGSIDFTAPASLYDGTSASGALTYHVLVGRNEVSSGNTSYGAAVSVPLTMPKEDNYVFDVYVSNAVGAGPQTRLKTFVGKGKPAAPQNVKAVMNDNLSNTITWEPVITSADGGYVDPAEITYTIKYFGHSVCFGEDAVNSEGILVEGIKGTSYTTQAPEALPNSLLYTLSRYEVSAKYVERESDFGKSNSVVWGGYNVPYINNIDKQSDLGGFTIIDDNDDNIVWKFDEENMAATIEFNQSKDMDDWLITPGIWLNKGDAYTIKYKAKRYDISYPELLEVKMGRGNAVADMTVTLLEAGPVEDVEYQTYELSVIPEETGTYFIGFHGCSKKYMYNIWIDDIEISEGKSALVPAVVDNLKAVSDPDGSLKITLSFNAPLKTLNGSTLTELTKVEVFGADLSSPLKVFETPTPGAALVFEDVPAAMGEYIYTVVAHNSYGKGEAAEVSVYAGIDRPAVPQNVCLVETDNYGEVTISWDAVTADYKGNPINPALVTYSIYTVDGVDAGTLIKDKIEATSYTFQVVTSDQEFAQYMVYAETMSGESVDGTVSDMISVGFPYETVYESFADGYLSYAWGIDIYGGGEWAIYTKGDGEIEAQDGDNGFAVMYGSVQGYYSDLYTGKIFVSEELVNPTLSFYRFVMGDNDTNNISIIVREIGAEDVEVYSKNCNDITTKRGWAKSEVSLNDFKGKTVQIIIRATVGQFMYSFVDNIRFASLVDNDLSVFEITAPSKAEKGGGVPVELIVSNDGRLEASGAKVGLYVDGVQVAVQDVPTLASEAKTMLTFEPVMDALSDKPVEIYADIVYAADQNTVNNKSNVIIVEPKASKLPGVRNLTGTLANGVATLSWNVPDVLYGAITEDFEDADSWAHNYNEWTFLDLDEIEAGGLNGIDLPGIVMGQTKTSFFIFDDSDAQFGSDFEAYSGHKYMTSMFNVTFSSIDDWAISPELSGEAQTISFYAKSYSGEYPEKMQLLYSMSGCEVDDFVLVDLVDKVADEWTLYKFDVPAGAKYFAIRSYASDNYLLMIDDVSYIPAYANALLLGYNVYRNGQKLNPEPLTSTSYVDAEAGESATYQVTVVYDRGESSGTEKLVLGADGIIDTAADASTPAIYYDLRGIKINSPKKGIYIRRQGQTTQKIQIK